MHRTRTEVLEAVMIAEPWMTPFPTSTAITNACYRIALPLVFAPLLRCSWLILGSFFFSHRREKVLLSLSVEAFSCKVVWI